MDESDDVHHVWARSDDVHHVWARSVSCQATPFNFGWNTRDRQAESSAQPPVDLVESAAVDFKLQIINNVANPRDSLRTA